MELRFFKPPKPKETVLSAWELQILDRHVSHTWHRLRTPVHCNLQGAEQASDAFLRVQPFCSAGAEVQMRRKWCKEVVVFSIQSHLVDQRKTPMADYCLLKGLGICLIGFAMFDDPRFFIPPTDFALTSTSLIALCSPASP